MPDSKLFLVVAGILFSVGFSLAVGNYLHLGYVEENAKLLHAPTPPRSESNSDDVSQTVQLLRQELQLERDQSASFHATLIERIQAERKGARDNALLWLAALLIFGMMATAASRKNGGSPKRHAA